MTRRQSLTRWFKPVLPKSLFGRSLMILVLPVVLVQGITAYIFYDRHWASVTRQLSASLVGEIASVVARWDAADQTIVKRVIIADAEQNFGFRIELEPPSADAEPESVDFRRFAANLARQTGHPVHVRELEDKERLVISVALNDAVMRIVTPQKRLAGSTTHILMYWMLGASLLFLLIAIGFLRNQIRPIVHLARAAEEFGRGQDAQALRPSGAREVRKAGRAFIDMRERIRRQVDSRTAMLAGISHDLRTPLTRLKLQLAMLPPGPEIEGLEQDVADMEHMVQEYLAFARGEGSEPSVPMPLSQLLEEAMEPYLRSGRDVRLGHIPPITVTIKPRAIKRVLRNVLDNALRYGSEATISARAQRKSFFVMIEDNGPGIPEKDRASVFQAFRRLEQSRNTETGGVGLGLTIVRDIVHAHGGDVWLEDAKSGGLCVVIKLPR